MEDLDELKARLLNEVKSIYPSERAAIRDRYTDTSYYIFKTSQAGGHRGSFLSFGSRRSSLVSSYGNTPTFMRRSFSSNGMLEYGVEQVGSNKWKDNHNIPEVTKEEKEIEELEEAFVNQDEKSSLVIEYNSPSKKPGSRGNTNNRHGLLFSETMSTENSESDSKNRKIFQHYDVPPRRPSPNIREDNDSACSLEYAVKEDADNRPSKREINSSDGSQVEFNTKRNISNSSFPIELQEVPDGKNENVLPKISVNILSTSPGEVKRSNLKINQESLAKDQKHERVSLPPTPEASVMERSGSMNERNRNPFLRQSVNRLSLRDLPRRSPTPPKRSPRKGTKSNKDKESGKKSFSSAFEKKKHSFATESPVSSSLPPLIPSQHESGEKDSVHQAEYSSLPLVSSKLNQSLDDTPLFIVEDENFEKPPISPRVGIQNLASDGMLNRSFIVVHPTSDSNSLGLAPLPVHNNKKSTDLSTTERMLNGRKGSFTQTSQFSSSSTVTNKRLNNSVASSYFFTKSEKSHVKLLKFSKSVDSSLVSPSIPSSKNSPLRPSEFHITKGRIKSYPCEIDFDNDQLNFDSSEKYINSNSSRLCIVM